MGPTSTARQQEIGIRASLLNQILVALHEADATLAHAADLSRQAAAAYEEPLRNTLLGCSGVAGFAAVR